MLRLSQFAARLKAITGLDGAIAYAISARIWTIIGNVGTVLLMLHFLSPVEQGYYFTLISLATLQVMFELGFSFVILQLAAHERAYIEIFPDGHVEGDPRAYSRLASILQLTLRWYSRAAIALGLLLLPLGLYFFSRSEQPGAPVQWLLPCIASVLSCVFLFILNPMFSFMEGCGEVRQVAKLRLFQCIANSIVAWACMLTHHGLYAPAMIMISSGLVGSHFLWHRRKFLLGLVRHPENDNSVSWRHEIWPFQWKIAISWLCAYFTMQIFTPMLFHYRNAVEAGQMGMSLSIIGYISAIVLAWMTTKAAPFGKLVAQGELAQLDRLFFLTLRQAVLFLVPMIVTCMVTIFALQRYFPKLAVRLVSPTLFAILLGGMVGSVLVQSMAVYLRSFKREPFLWQSVAIAALTLISSRLTVKTMGTVGISLSYLLCTGAFGLLSGLMIFRSWHRRIATPERSPLLVLKREH